MAELKKALLLEINANDDKARPNGKRVSVQFNPASLRMQFASHSEGGTQAGRQARQYTGTGSTTLTVDLVFDTADEGSTTEAKPVLERTRDLEYFMTPQKVRGRNDAPPRLSFQWGTLRVDGVMETLSVDLDHFASDGTALRAKASLTVRGQNAELQRNLEGAGDNSAVGATPAAASASGAAAPGGGLGLLAGLGVLPAAGLAVASSAGAGIAQALEGESLAQMAARTGLQPEAWRALAAGVTNPLSLAAGQEIVLPDPADTGLGMGAAEGVQAGADPGPARRLGLQTATDAAPALGSLRRGYALAAAGGLGAALETVKTAAGSAAVAQARLAFRGAGGAPATGPGDDPEPDRASTFMLRADPRAAGYGRGVPLRDRVQVAHDERANLLSGQAVVKRAGDGLPPTTGDPSVPGWIALPQAPAAAAAARAHPGRCGCNGRR